MKTVFIYLLMHIFTNIYKRQIFVIWKRMFKAIEFLLIQMLTIKESSF